MLRKRILFVDDDADWRLIVSGFLEDNGYEVVTAKDASEATILVAGGPTLDLIILDRNLGGQDGVALLKPLKQSQPGARIILYTGRRHDSAQIKALLQKGADHYLRKGTMEELLDGVRNALGES